MISPDTKARLAERARCKAICDKHASWDLPLDTGGHSPEYYWGYVHGAISAGEEIMQDDQPSGTVDSEEVDPISAPDQTIRIIRHIALVLLFVALLVYSMNRIAG